MPATPEECRRHLAALLGGGSDAREAAERLIGRFGSLGAVLAANRRGRLADEAQVGESERLAEFVAAVRYLLRRRVERRPLLRLDAALADHLAFDMACDGMERFRVLYLDRAGNLLADEIVSEGSIAEAPIRRRDIVFRSLQIDASKLVLVHNHPSGDPTPSPADIDVTRKLTRDLWHLGVTVFDHVIVSRSGCVSFRRMGIL